MSRDDIGWGTDTPISLPVPPKDNILVDFGTLGFTEFGMAHNISAGDIADYLPIFLPVARDDG